jgi:hypothetical protein
MPNFRMISSFAIGFIPFLHPEKHSLPQVYANYARGSMRKIKAMDLLFSSGNNPKKVQEIFVSSDAVKKFATTRDYRGLLALGNIILEVPAHGNLALSYDAWLSRDEEIGYTPYRLPFLGKFLKLGHPRGDGTRREPVVESNGQTAYLSHRVEFRIGWFGNFVGRLLTGYWAPYVWMQVEYLSRRDGSYLLTLSGSCIPTQVRLSSVPAREAATVAVRLGDSVKQPIALMPGNLPQVLYVHDMKGNSADDVSDFFTRGNLLASEAYSIIFAVRGNPLTEGATDEGE